MQEIYFVSEIISLHPMMEIFMTEEINIANAKKHLSEIINRASSSGTRFILNKRKKPVAAIISIRDLENIKTKEIFEKKGTLLQASEAWAEFESLDEIIQDIYLARLLSVDRAVEL
jgi:prevent-host-death family protein